MTPRRLAAWCAVLAALSAAPAHAQKAGDAGALKLRIYGSLLPGVSKADAKGFTQPLCDLLGRQLDLRLDCDIHEGSTVDDLFEFGKKLNAGEYQLGAVWGLEYGWLREKYPKLKVLVLVSNGEKDPPNSTQLWVRKDGPFKKLADLQGKKLAVYKGTPLMDRLFLRRMIEDEKLSPKGFLAESDPYGSVKSAVAAVRDGTADCVLINQTTFGRLRDLQPGLIGALVELKRGPNFPLAVIIGSPDVVDSMRKRKGLWADLRDHFLDVHNFPEGKECINFWRFQSFVAADDDLFRKIDDLARKVPVSALTAEK
jgi:ABC-type phosphate/phosphonate transport system substrate-binding protein